MYVLYLVQLRAPSAAPAFTNPLVALGFSSTGWLHRQVQQNAAAALQHHNIDVCIDRLLTIVDRGMLQATSLINSNNQY